MQWHAIAQLATNISGTEREFYALSRVLFPCPVWVRDGLETIKSKSGENYIYSGKRQLRVSSNRECKSTRLVFCKAHRQGIRGM